MKPLTLGLSSLLLVALVAVGASAFPYWKSEQAEEALSAGDYDGFVVAVQETRCSQFAEHFTEERFEQLMERNQHQIALQQALADGDYAAWRAALDTFPQWSDRITEENFDAFVAMHNARMDGDVELAEQYAEQLGINMPGYGKGMHRGFHGHALAGTGMRSGNGFMRGR